MKRKLRHFWKRLCLGLTAAGRTENANKINPVGATSFKARHSLPIAALATAAIAVSAQGQDRATAPYAGMMEGNNSNRWGSDLYHAIRDTDSHMTSTDWLKLGLDAMSGKPSGQIALSAAADSLARLDAYNKGYQAGVNAGPFPSQIAVGPLSGTNGMFRWGTTTCDY